MFRVVALGLFVASLMMMGCGPAERCSTATCRGCCDQAGVCRGGAENLACGVGGTACIACGIGQSCGIGYVCSFSSGSISTGGGAASTGGGSAGTTGGGGGSVATGGGSVGSTGGGSGATGGGNVGSTGGGSVATGGGGVGSTGGGSVATGGGGAGSTGGGSGSTGGGKAGATGGGAGATGGGSATGGGDPCATTQPPDYPLWPMHDHASFVANTDSTITDKVTGLTWKNATSGTGYTWAQAQTACPCGWRLPQRIELVSILDYSYVSPAVSHSSPFYLGAAEILWSATPSGPSKTNAFTVGTADGQVVIDAVATKHTVLCVKSPPVTGSTSPRFQAQTNGTVAEVKDLFTGLVWAAKPLYSSQTAAQTYCTGLGKDVYIVPSAKQAQTLFHTASVSGTWVDTSFFMGGLMETWTSSLGPSQNKGWLVSFASGVQSIWSSDSHQLMCVR